MTLIEIVEPTPEPKPSGFFAGMLHALTTPLSTRDRINQVRRLQRGGTDLVDEQQAVEVFLRNMLPHLADCPMKELGQALLTLHEVRPDRLRDYHQNRQSFEESLSKIGLSE